MSAAAAITTQQTARYLARNAELRHAFGIADDAKLVPQPLGRGEHNVNHVFADPATGRRFVLRINVLSQPFHDNQVAYEFAALSALAPSRRVPEPLYLDDSRKLLPYGALVISFCPGQELDFDHLRPGDLQAVANILADIHATPIPTDCPLYRPKDPLIALYRECLDRYEIYRSSQFEELRITRWVERFIAAVQPALDAPFECDTGEKNPSRRIINTETLPSHFLLESERDEVGDSGDATTPKAAKSASEKARNETSASLSEDPYESSSPTRPATGFMVDWERPIVGEVAQDLAYFTAPTTSYWDSSYVFDQNRSQELVERYWQAVDGRFDRAGFDERYRAYRMMAALRSTTWCCRALTWADS